MKKDNPPDKILQIVLGSSQTPRTLQRAPVLTITVRNCPWELDASYLIGKTQLSIYFIDGIGIVLLGLCWKYIFSSSFIHGRHCVNHLLLHNKLP